jgi:biotin carboxylase
MDGAAGGRRGSDPRKENPCPQGHAIEARLYAEAPHAGFRPSPGG